MPSKRLSLLLLALLVAGGLSLRGDGTFGPRATRLGNQLICTCGCTQGALVCTTLNCSIKLHMQDEIRRRALSKQSDSLILQSFVQEYGTEVLANPTTQGFNLTAWVMPWVVLGLGLVLVLFFMKRFRDRAQPAPAAPEPTLPMSALSSEVAAELEREINPSGKNAGEKT